MKDIQFPLSKRLKQARLNKGLSQRALGTAVGMDEFTASARMNHYEQGRRIPSYQTVHALADYLGLPTSYFYEDNDDIASLLESMQNLNKKQIKN